MGSDVRLTPFIAGIESFFPLVPKVSEALWERCTSLETPFPHCQPLLAAGKAEHKTRSTWQLWQEGYHPQAIYSDQTMLQKIDYIHANPVRRGWVASPEHWRYSSADEWLPGAQPVLRCDSWR